ncbi:hypothetical protein K525DRAFT_198717 [Schizophyllum commune Loenen D]|nr:hypothetical protein K525DRAFT_198717 [Schizophyllum commune Loenen D]
MLMISQELFRKTVGPLRDVFLIYNSQGHSKGMAIVAFQRKGDAAVARAKYHGKVVDGRRPILIEIIVDDDAPSAAAPAGPPSLIERIGGGARRLQKRATAGVGVGGVGGGAAAGAAVKTQPKTKEQLDQEMEDYRAAASS